MSSLNLINLVNEASRSNLQAIEVARAEGIVIRDFAAIFDDNLLGTDELLSENSALSALFAAVEEQWRSTLWHRECEPALPDGEEFGDITIVRDDGAVFIDPRDISPGPWICLDDDPKRQWPPYESFMVIEPNGMDTTPLDKLWEEKVTPVILPGRTLSPMLYDGRRCMFSDLRDDTAAVTEYVGVKNIYCPDQQLYSNTQIDGLLALQHHLGELGKMTARHAFADGRRPHCRTTNYVQMSTPLTLMRFKSSLLTMFAEVTKEYSSARAQLRRERLQAELEKDTIKSAKAAKRRRFLNQRMFEDAADRVTANMSAPLLMQQEQQLGDLENLYALFEVHRYLLMREDLNVLQTIERFEALQKRVHLYTTTQVESIEEQIDDIDAFLTTCNSLAYKVATRVRTISVTDFSDEAEKRPNLNRSAKGESGLETFCVMSKELEGIEALLGQSIKSIAQVESFLETLTGPVLDAYVLIQDLRILMEGLSDGAYELDPPANSSETDATAFERHKTGALSTVDEESVSSR